MQFFALGSCSSVWLSFCSFGISDLEAVEGLFSAIFM